MGPINENIGVGEIGEYLSKRPIFLNTRFWLLVMLLVAHLHFSLNIRYLLLSCFVSFMQLVMNGIKLLFRAVMETLLMSL